MYPAVKRFFDFVFALLALLVLSPLLIPIVIGLKLTGEGYVFYLQERVGYRNRLFNIYKFATMLKDSPNMKGGIITTAKDPRITPMGGFLRKSKINELPQLLNVLFGDMSFVGPRPVMQKSFDQYPPEVQEVIYNVKPGITGIGSIVFRDEEQLITAVRDRGGDTWAYYRDVIYPHKGRVEEWYQANQSFWVDLKILFLTAWVILRPESDLVYRAFPEVPVFKPGTP
ncbi:lipopolysaccharide/colanic/teichoic acid biosynthesis glycosyltransferase [Lewinella marina]|uniref:Lipid carrier--UDP-N-acetylgalactosaminyltransferase n=1 Tax=Neolewinella marina TaxID=438751 RepID=A0A2G0CBX9_9BACT|nr:sugar transferase [Neolewinella marina]NJB86667.1 lipopolysaccharide/colanic/teichoic acid biosynthesis glycosyltransferase [Neolewinella marina]PHK97475.1 lipid carrier--UDP-N-acetylgalactosaminyltransferase [Neolewinella marina]